MRTIESGALAVRAARDEVLCDLTYTAYRWQRTFYGISAERLAPWFPLAEKYEQRLKEEAVSSWG